MLVLQITGIVVLAFAGARWLDRRDAARDQAAELAWARRQADRALLADLNDGSWPAFMAERIETTSTEQLRSAA